MKKRWIALLLGVAAVFGSVGCGAKEYRASDMSEYIELGQYTGFEVEMDTEVTDEELQEEIQYLRENYAEYEQIKEGTVVSGSTVNIDYSGVLEGETEPFEGGTDSDHNLTIGSHSMIDTFEEQLIGHAPGETVNVAATFPEDYGVEDLNGKLANFTVTINYICGNKVVPEWTDEFVSKFTEGGYSSTEDYEAYLKDYYSANKKEEAENNKKTTVLQNILDNANVIQYSQEEVDEYYNDCVNYYTTLADTYYGCTLAEFAQNMMGVTEEQFKEDAENAAYQYVVGNIALLAIANKEGISLTEKEYNERLEKMAEEYGYTDAAQIEEECAEYGKTYLWDELLRDKAMEFVLETVIEI